MDGIAVAIPSDEFKFTTGWGGGTPSVAYSCGSADTELWLSSKEPRNVELLPHWESYPWLKWREINALPSNLLVNTVLKIGYYYTWKLEKTMIFIESPETDLESALKRWFVGPPRLHLCCDWGILRLPNVMKWVCEDWFEGKRGQPSTLRCWLFWYCWTLCSSVKDGRRLNVLLPWWHVIGSWWCLGHGAAASALLACR